MADNAVVTIAEVAQLMRLSQPTIRLAIRSGRLKAVKVNGGRLWRIRSAWLEEFLISGRITLNT
jgi:excisionase family DNA binding protein